MKEVKLTLSVCRALARRRCEALYCGITASVPVDCKEQPLPLYTIDSTKWNIGGVKYGGKLFL